MLLFPYVPHSLNGPPPPSLPPGVAVRWRPFLPARVISPIGQHRAYSRRLLDSGSDDTLFPMGAATYLGLKLRSASGHLARWGGQRYSLVFGDVELELSDETGAVWRWPAVVGFTPAPLRYPLLDIAGCLEFMIATFRGQDRLVELETNGSYPGTCS